MVWLIRSEHGLHLSSQVTAEASYRFLRKKHHGCFWIQPLRAAPFKLDLKGPYFNHPRSSTSAKRLSGSCVCSYTKGYVKVNPNNSVRCLINNYESYPRSHCPVPAAPIAVTHNKNSSTNRELTLQEITLLSGWCSMSQCEHKSAARGRWHGVFFIQTICNKMFVKANNTKKKW